MGEKDYDPTMHTIEHLLNGTVDRLFGCGRAYSTHIEKKKSKCDFRFDRNLTPIELDSIQQQVNEQIAAGLSVTDEEIPIDQAKTQYNLSRVPEGAELIRIVHIGDYDSCPCIGHHVPNTKELPPVVIISSDHNDGVLRIRFKPDKSALK